MIWNNLFLTDDLPHVSFHNAMADLTGAPPVQFLSSFMQFSGEMAKIVSLPSNGQCVSKLLVYQEYTDAKWPVTKFAKWACLGQKRKGLDRLSRIMMI